MKKVSVSRLLFLNVLYCIFANFAHPVTPTFIQNLGLHDYMFGVAFAAMAFSNFSFSPLWGKLARRFGSVNILTFGYLGYGLCQLMFGNATTELGIFLARLCGGFFISSISVNQLIYIMDNSSEDNRGINLANNATLYAVISPFGFLIGGLIGDHSIKMAFVCQAIGLSFTGILHYLFLKDGEDAIKDRHMKLTLNEINPFKSFIDAKNLLIPIVVTFLLITLVTTFASTCYEQCFNYYIKDQFNFPSSYNGFLKAAVGFITLLANSTIALYLMKKTNIFKTTPLVLMVCLLMMVSIVLINDVVPFIIINVIFFGFNAVYQPLLQKILSSFVKGESGQLVGVYNSSKSFGNVLGSLLAGLIYGFGPKLSFVASALAFLVAIILAYIQKGMKENEGI